MPRQCARVWIGVILAAAGAASAQSYPNKPVRIVTSGVGAATDFVARTMAQGLTPLLGQQVIVDNRASGFTPAEIVARAARRLYAAFLREHRLDHPAPAEGAIRCGEG